MIQETNCELEQPETMADEPKPNQPSEAPKDPAESPAATNISEAPAPAGDGNAPADAAKTPEAGTKLGEGVPAAPNASASGPQPDPLSDGTKPTILKPGDGHRPVLKGKTSITSIYRKADIATTLFTFVGAVVASALVLGGYVFFTRQQAPVTDQNPTKVTTLDKAELEKLDQFFGSNALGKPTEVLTVSSSSLFKGRVAVSSDVKIVGSLQVSGPTNLADLIVDKTSTLGVTNVRGALTADGPTNLRGAAILGAGGTVNGNFAVSGNGSYGGSIAAGVMNARDINVSGTLNLAGHLAIAGSNPTAGAASSAASSATVTGNDSGGTVTVVMPPTSAVATGGLLVTVTFRTPYARVPKVVITPIGRAAAILQPYIIKTANDFTIGASIIPANSNTTSFSFDYWVVQ